MSRAVGLRFSKSFGGQSMVMEGIVEETREDGLRAIRDIADKMIARAKEKLSVRGDGPSRPGEPPAMHDGMLVDGIGRTPGYVSKKKGVISIAWGFGIGKEALARIDEWAARRGEDRGTMFAIANMNEYGSVNYELVRSHPMRPFVRNTEAELKDEAVASIERAIKVHR